MIDGRTSNHPVDKKFFRYHEPLPKHKWPYKTKVRNHKWAVDLVPAQPSPDDCKVCNGKGGMWYPKNERTGSLRFKPCKDCMGSGRATA